MNQNYSYTQVVAEQKSFFQKTIGLLNLNNGTLLFVTKNGTQELGDILNITFKIEGQKIIIKNGDKQRTFNYPANTGNYEKNVRPLFALAPASDDTAIKNTFELLKTKVSEYVAGQYLDGKVPNEIAGTIFEASGAQKF